MSYFTTAAEGPWTLLDREYFRKHKARQWYIRDLTLGEEYNIQRYHNELYDAILDHWKSDPSVPAKATMRVLVLQIRPGERMRIPLLDWEGRDKIKLWMRIRHGERDGVLEEIPIQEFLADMRMMRAADGWQTTPKNQDPSGDFCNLCGLEFTITQVNVHVRVDGLAKLACLTCAQKDNILIEGVGLFIANQDMNDPARMQVAGEMLREMVETLKASGLIKQPS